MRDFFTAYTNTNGVVFPDTEGVNASGPSETDGTEFVDISVDDGFGWGWMQALLSAAGLTPNGSAESVSNSQLFDSWELLFGIPDGYISGLIPAIAADTDHDITFGVGEARSDLAASLARILLATAITKQIDANWVAGDDVGGFPSGLTLTADTWYHLFVIKNNSTGVVDAGFDTSLTATNLLADATGYTEFKRIGSVLVDSASNILGFSMEVYLSGMREVLWDDPPLDLDVDTLGTTATLFPLSTPLGVKTMAKFRAAGGAAGSAQIILTSPDQDDEAPTVQGAGTPPLFDIQGDSDLVDQFQYRTNTSSEIRARASSATQTLSLVTLGWSE